MWTTSVKKMPYKRRINLRLCITFFTDNLHSYWSFYSNSNLALWLNEGSLSFRNWMNFRRICNPSCNFFGKSVTFPLFLHTLFWSNANPNTNCCSFVRYCKLEQHCKLLAMTFLDTPLKPGARKGASNRYYDRIISCSDLFDDFIFYMSKEDHPSPRVALFYG